jgi:hypothetical protein
VRPVLRRSRSVLPFSLIGSEDLPRDARCAAWGRSSAFLPSSLFWEILGPELAGSVLTDKPEDFRPAPVRWLQGHMKTRGNDPSRYIETIKGQNPSIRSWPEAIRLRRRPPRNCLLVQCGRSGRDGFAGRMHERVFVVTTVGPSPAMCLHTTRERSSPTQGDVGSGVAISAIMSVMPRSSILSDVAAAQLQVSRRERKRCSGKGSRSFISEI